jgi:hypothetical protein
LIFGRWVLENNDWQPDQRIPQKMFHGIQARFNGLAKASYPPLLGNIPDSQLWSQDNCLRIKQRVKRSLKTGLPWLMNTTWFTGVIVKRHGISALALSILNYYHSRK